MADDRVPQSESNRQIQASFWALLNEIDAYEGPTETEQQQYAFFESFLENYPLRQTKRSKFGWHNHTPKTFMRSLKDAIGTHGRKHPKGLEKSMKYFFKSKMSTFSPKYMRKCQDASEKQRDESIKGKNHSSGDSIVTTQPRNCEDDVPRPRAESEVSSCTIMEEDAHPMWKELQGFRGSRTMKRHRSLHQASGSKKRKGNPKQGIDDMPSKEALVSKLPEVQVIIPQFTSPQGRLQDLRGGCEVDTVSMGVPDSAEDKENTAISRPHRLDRRFVASQMGHAERLYSQFRRSLGDGVDDQASFDADPPQSLEQLYKTAFGHDWRVVYASLQQQRLAEIADILFALTGAAIYERVLQSLAPGLHDTFSLPCKEERGQTPVSPSKFVFGHGLSRRVVRDLSVDLNEHMRHQPPRASRPDGFISKDLKADLLNAVENAFVLRSALDVGMNVRWHRPLEMFDFGSMRTEQTQPTPPAENVHLWKVAMCFLPSIEKVEAPGRPLYKAMVKAADGL